MSVCRHPGQGINPGVKNSRPDAEPDNKTQPPANRSIVGGCAFRLMLLKPLVDAVCSFACGFSPGLSSIEAVH